MSQVLITKSKLDSLANTIASKAAVAAPLTIAQMETAVRNIPTGGSATLITKSITANGTYSAQDDSADGYSSVTVNVPTSTPSLQSKTVSPTESQQTVSADSGYDGLSSVTVNAMPTGTAGTPTVTKGTVSNYTVTVTPSVTNTTGYIAGGTKTGTSVTVSASELVSGSQTVTENDTYDVTNLASLIVNVAGGASPLTLIDERTIDVTTTSTQAATATTITNSALSTKDKIIWVHIRDTNGKRAGYFYGSDTFFINWQKGNGSTSTFTTPTVNCLRVSTSNLYASTVGQYGVYGYSISNAGALIVRRRYNSNYSLTIDGSFKISTYILDLPTGLYLFE